MWFPVDPRLPPASHRSTAYSLWNGYAAFAASIIDSSWALGQDCLAQACRQFASDPRATWNDGRRIMEAPHPAAQDLGSPYQRQTAWEIDGKPVMLPVRVGDASQGWVFYTVSAAKAQQRLQQRYPAPDRSGSDLGRPMFEVLGAGSGSTLLGVFALDYRRCDLGACRQLGVVLFATPHDDPTSPPGMVFLGLAVSAALPSHATRKVWGVENTHAERLDVRYEHDRAVFAADLSRYDRKEMCLSVAFPRFGSNRSRDLPFHFYSLSANGPTHSAPQRTLFSRSGSREGIRFGDTVVLTYGDPEAKCCLADGRATDCLCKILRQFDLKSAVANTWSEHVAGTLHRPEPC